MYIKYKNSYNWSNGGVKRRILAVAMAMLYLHLRVGYIGVFSC